MISANNLTSYIGSTSNYGVIPFKDKQDPSGWAIPFVTGHKYKVSFGSGPLDWTSINIDQSSRWQTNDKTVYLIMNFTDVRARVNVTAGGTLIPNNTLNILSSSQWSSGDNVIYNDTATRQIHVVFNGKD